MPKIQTLSFSLKLIRKDTYKKLQLLQNPPHFGYIFGRISAILLFGLIAMCDQAFFTKYLLPLNWLPNFPILITTNPLLLRFEKHIYSASTSWYSVQFWREIWVFLPAKRIILKLGSLPKYLFCGLNCSCWMWTAYLEGLHCSVCGRRVHHSLWTSKEPNVSK